MTYEKLTIPLTENLDIECSLVKNFVENVGNCLYRVDNLEEFVERQEFNDILANWSSEYQNKKNSEGKKPKTKGVSSHEFDERNYV